MKKFLYYRKCKECRVEFGTDCKKQIYCNYKCNQNNYYGRSEKRRESALKNARAWDKRNPEKRKEIAKKSCDKFRKNNPERFNELMRNSYKRNKVKYFSRKSTTQFLKKNNLLEKECKRCSSKENLEKHHEVYPTKFNEIEKAIKDNKIYYLCRKCHGRRNKHNKNNVAI